MAEPRLGPSSSGSVVLDFGPGQGVLVLHTPPELDGREIEISPLGSQPGHRTHSQVRQRHTARGVLYAAVYPGLPAADYEIWGDALAPVLTVTVSSGVVTSAAWPGAAPGR
jgi:hypothetical protein